ncbi:hypothetical protein RRF57_002684 [Xylaria bambusicola]|uniref:Uncharacterized protein n=1 Tax=Xylaria bambusicola TaxID=326684 RepID=A0AAN7UJD0_9PEZI
MPFSALKTLEIAMLAATIHSDIGEGFSFTLDSVRLLTNGRRVSTDPSTFRRRFTIANTTGSKTQHNNSDVNSDRLVAE